MYAFIQKSDTTVWSLNVLQCHMLKTQLSMWHHWEVVDSLAVRASDGKLGLAGHGLHGQIRPWLLFSLSII